MPPYSDNLYSADDDVSDSESFSDELTPSDGYFNRSSMPNNRQQVPDPTIDYGPPEAKTLIDPSVSHPRNTEGSSRRPFIHPDVSSHAPVPSSPPYVSPATGPGQTDCTPVSPVFSRRRDASFSDNEQLMFQPPPAYSESPPPSSLPSVRSSVTSYSTFPFQHLEGGYHLTQREPQSMGGPVEHAASEQTPLIGSRRFPRRRRRGKAILVTGLVLIVIGSTLAVLLGCSDRSNSKERLLDVEVEYCPGATIRKPQKTYEFASGKSLNIIHRTKDDTNSKGFSSVSVEGEIRLRKAPPNSKHGSSPYITVHLGSSTELMTTLDWSDDSQTLRLTTPTSVRKHNPRFHCLYAIITAFFPEDIQLTTLQFDSPSLNLALSDVRLNVTERSQFTTSSGAVWLTASEDLQIQAITNPKHPALSSQPRLPNPPVTTETELLFSSRRIVVETGSGSITGTYPLLDDLVLSSESGEVNVCVSPRPASKNGAAPADLEVQTSSGNIRVDLPLDKNDAIPSREYITRVHSTSGSISGSYLIGSDNHFQTTSGGIDIVTLPVLPEEKETSRILPNVLETHTVSGNTRVSVLDPVIFPVLIAVPKNNFDPYEALPPPVALIETSVQDTTQSLSKPSSTSKLRNLRSSHTSNSGTIYAKYPDSWQGTVHAKSVSGEIAVLGDGFRTVKERHGYAYREVLKKRGVEGAEGSRVEIGTVSGYVDFEVSKS